jgi:catechol 2,3-dioxygenase-like lactoylglutathione lyase family enzyme
MSSPVTGISHISYRVRDIGETVAFFTEKLGFTLLRRWVASDGWEGAYIELGDVLLEVMKADESELPGPGQLDRKLGLVVPDLDAALAELTAKGVKVGIQAFEPRTFWGRQAGIYDPSGYIISLREWRAPDGPRFAGWEPGPGVTRLA